MTNYTPKPYVVRHRPKYRSWRNVAFFETAREALAKYEKLTQTYLTERVWVVDLLKDQVIADSQPCRRR